MPARRGHEETKDKDLAVNQELEGLFICPEWNLDYGTGGWYNLINRYERSENYEKKNKYSVVHSVYNIGLRLILFYEIKARISYA